MNAMPARNLKFKESEEFATTITPLRKNNRNNKVIELPLPKKAAKAKTLSPRKQEELVLTYRMKARKLARSILRKWHARLDLQEVDSVVDLSLCEAVRRYNPNKGASFMTFLFYHMRGNLIRAVASAATANAVPLPQVEDASAGAKSEQASYRGVNAIEIAEALCSHDYVMPDEMLLKKEMVSMSHGACEKLDSLEKEVIYRIYIQEQQLMDIASSLGYSRCHISRVKKKALETLYGDMSSAIHKGDEESALQARPDFDDEDGAGERRKIHRRRPRSRKAVRVNQEIGIEVHAQ
ncbi:MAG: sigma-70 family RNA polymerase sigma factor [Deltaproteobacteria bacterium]|nr:sigma-70 family RNA polymerase sigma factor [Deltaproteobacteria bacterium]